MYTIYRGTDGQFHCQGRLQDSTERWVRPTLEEAVKSMKSFARNCNGVKIKKRDITFLRPKRAEEIEWVRWHPFGKKKS